MVSRFYTGRNFVVLIFVGFVAALGVGVAISSKDATAAEPDGLGQKRWLIIELAGKSVGMGGDLIFRDGRVSGASACNFFSGETKFTGPGQLSVEVDRMTRRGCSGEALEVERAYFDTLKTVTSFKFTDDTRLRLELQSGDKKTLAVLVAEPEFKLENSPLKIVSYLFDGGLYGILNEQKATLRFRDGAVSGDTGCRAFSGSYERNGNALSVKIDQPLQEPRTCSAPEKRQDGAIIAHLQQGGELLRERSVIRLVNPETEDALLWIASDPK